MKRVSANICYTHSTEDLENKMLISFDVYIVPPLWPHILWLYWGRNDSELVLWPVEWSLISGWAFAQFLRLIRVLACTFRGVSSRNFAEFLREMSRSFSAKIRGENPWRNRWFLFFSAKKFISRKGCSAAKREKRAFFLGWSVQLIVI